MAAPHGVTNLNRSHPVLPDPLHPALVHFPIVLMILLPLAAAAAMIAIRRGAAPRRVWLLPLVTAAALSGSAWVAVETGEGEEETVEALVPESSLHGHEESAERFLLLSAAVLALTAAGLFRGTAGWAARGGALAGSLALAALGAQVGHSGGTLVYRDGAAAAYAPAAGSAAQRASAEPVPEAGEDDD